MKNFFTPKVRTVLALCAALAILTAVIGAVTNGATPGEKLTGTLLSPLRGGFAAVARQAERVYDYLFRYDALEAENQALRQKISAMEQDVRDAQAMKRENERLNNLLKLSEQHPDYQYLSAYVTAWDSSNWKSACTLSKGSGAGIEEGMCAVTEYGQVVGMVTAVGPGWATVTTVRDPSLEIAASVTSTGYTGVAQCSYDGSGLMRLSYLPTDAVVRNNDQVVTTGSTFYPKDLILGYVRDAGLDETGVGKYATIAPAADLDNLEQVFLIAQYEQ